MASESEALADSHSSDKKTLFVVYCAPRTGSYHLTSLLDSAPDIVCHGELFKQGRVELATSSHSDKLANFRPPMRDRRPWVFIRKVRELDPGLHFGFKVFREHVRRVKRLQDLMANEHWKKLALLRDPVEVYASLLRARETGQWVKKKGNEAVPQADLKVVFEPESLDRFKRFYLPFAKDVLDHKNDPDWMIVYYDDVNDLATRQEILDFIGSSATAVQLTTQYEKQYSRPVSEAFENWDELVEVLKHDEDFEKLDWPRATSWRGAAPGNGASQPE